MFIPTVVVVLLEDCKDIIATLGGRPNMAHTRIESVQALHREQGV